jgi:hypothetical protein
MASNRRNRTKGASDDKVGGDVGNDVTPPPVEPEPPAPVVKPNEGGILAALLKNSPWSSNTATSKKEEPAAQTEPVLVNPHNTDSVSDLVTRWSQPIWRIPSQVRDDGESAEVVVGKTAEHLEVLESESAQSHPVIDPDPVVPTSPVAVSTPLPAPSDVEPADSPPDDKAPDVSDEGIDVQAESMAEAEGIPDGTEVAHGSTLDADAEPAPDHEVLDHEALDKDVTDGGEPEPEVAPDDAMTGHMVDFERSSAGVGVEVGSEPENSVTFSGFEVFSEPELGGGDSAAETNAVPMPEMNAHLVDAAIPTVPLTQVEQAVISGSVEVDVGAVSRVGFVKDVPVEDLLTGIFNFANSAARRVIHASSDLVKNRGSVGAKITARSQKRIKSVNNTCGTCTT